MAPAISPMVKVFDNTPPILKITIINIAMKKEPTMNVSPPHVKAIGKYDIEAIKAANKPTLLSLKIDEATINKQSGMSPAKNWEIIVKAASGGTFESKEKKATIPWYPCA
jgi:hypothetical protein